MRRLLTSSLIVTGLFAAGPALAADTPYFTATGVFANKEVAIRGYDPIAYFEAGKPVEGEEEHSLQWGGVTWHFANAANKQAFEADPEAYAPEYGGYCAYAAAKGQLVSVDPDAWSIVDGKLYLNYSMSVQDKWEQDIDGFIAQANENWPDLNPAK
jgi:YHS domain-containing protein